MGNSHFPSLKLCALRYSRWQRKRPTVQVRFVLGPSGSGKPSRLVAEAQAALRSASGGPPLVYLCPKQSTFQVERQVLAERSLPGYTRLRVLSFERLADFILASFRRSARLLNN